VLLIGGTHLHTPSFFKVVGVCYKGVGGTYYKYLD